MKHLCMTLAAAALIAATIPAPSQAEESASDMAYRVAACRANPALARCQQVLRAMNTIRNEHFRLCARDGARLQSGLSDEVHINVAVMRENVHLITPARDRAMVVDVIFESVCEG